MQTIFASARFDLSSAADLFLTSAGVDIDDEGNIVEPDALDMPTVSFDEIEADLALEFYADELAEERAWERERQVCASCGATDDAWLWDEGVDHRPFVLAGNAFCCPKCFDRAREQHDRAEKLRMRGKRKQVACVQEMAANLGSSPSWWARHELRCARESLVSHW